MESLSSLFLHPVAALVGLAFATLPILIHLIRRTQYRRIQWAAMEFLLAAQKRMRRRMVLEEWLLLALRILLVLLVAFLLSRWLGSGSSGVGGDHLIVIDDSLSMDDMHDNQGTRSNAMDLAAKEASRLVRKLGSIRGIHHARIYLLSNLGEVVLEGKAGEDLARKADELLGRLRPGYRALDPVKALDGAFDIWAAAGAAEVSSHRLLHLLTDCRDADWNGPARDAARKALAHLAGTGANIRIVDVADPDRPQGPAVPIGHDNLGIVSLSGDSRLVVEGASTEFVATIKNFGSSPRRTFFSMRRDGVEDFAATQPVDEIPPGQETKVRLSLVLGRNRPAPNLRAGDDAARRDQERLLARSWVRLTAEIDDQPRLGLAQDNVRDLVVEVVPRIPVLVIDGSGRTGMSPGGDAFHIEAALSALRDYEPEVRLLEDLPRTRLELYPIIFLLNVAELPQTEVKRLALHVKEGNSLAWFVGDRTRPTFANSLFQEQDGLFPVLLGPRPTDPPAPQDKLDSRLIDEQPKILFPDPAHPIVAGVYPNRLDFRFLPIDRYWPTQARFQWDKADGSVRDIILLPNRRWKDERQRQQYREKALSLIASFPINDPAQAEFRTGLEMVTRELREALLSQSQFRLARSLEKTLDDAGDPADPKTGTAARSGLKLLWGKSAFQPIAASLRELLREVQFGDPLMVERTVGKGRVIACLTTAGTRTTLSAAGTEADGWNEWGSGSPMSWTYAAMMKELTKYLLQAGAGEGSTLLVGQGLDLSRDAAFLNGTARERFDPQRPTKVRGLRPGQQKLGVNQGDAPVGGRVRLRIPPQMEPGVLYLNLSPTIAPGQTPFGPEDGELEAFAINIDANHEGDLRRARRDLLELPQAGVGQGKAVLARPGDGSDSMLEPPRDTSETWWIYLIILLVLIGEQAMAVYCSHHAKNKEAAVTMTASRARPMASAIPNAKSGALPVGGSRE